MLARIVDSGLNAGYLFDSQRVGVLGMLCANAGFSLLVHFVLLKSMQYSSS